MPIKLSITLSSGGRFKPVDSLTLHDRKITIGRDDDCTLTLEDTQKHVSRVHAELEEEGGAYWMKVVSKVNPVVVNGKRYMFGERAALATGDTMAIGLYRLEVQPAAAAAAAPASPALAPAVDEGEEATYVPRPMAPPVPPKPPAEPEQDEEATFVPPPAAAPAPPPPPAAAAPAPPPAAPAMDPMDRVAQRIAQFRKQSEATQPSAAPAAAAGDLDFDLSELETMVPQRVAPPKAPTPPAPDESEEATLYRPPTPTPPAQAAPAPAAPPAPAEEPFDDEATMVRRPGVVPPPAKAAPATAAPQAEEPFDDEATLVRRPGTPPPAAPKPAEEPFDDEATMVRRPGAVPPPPAKAVEEPFDDEATLVRRPGAVPPPPKSAPAAPADEPFDDEATMVRRPGSMTPAPAPARAAPAAPAKASGDAALDAFLQGAGLTHLAVADAQAFMRESGALVRVVVEGLAKLMAARTETRNEIGVGSEESGNNPLSGMSGPEEILSFLFDPRRPAIPGSDPAEALAEACADLRAHQLALSAAMKAAVAGAVSRLDPKAIERDHGKSLGGLNLTRKSKLWDISVEQHEKLAQEMLGDFGAAFGREILAAYTAQVQKARGH